MCESVKNVLPRIAGSVIFTAYCTMASAAGCNKSWENPTWQRVEMRGMTLALEEYKDNERHFSIQRGNHSLDIYFLDHILLVKGPSRDEITGYSEDELNWYPMAFALPDKILSSVTNQPPCAVGNKVRFSQKLDGKLGFGPHKLTEVSGDMTVAKAGEIRYQFTATVVPALEGQDSITYKGSLGFAPAYKALPANTHITGYTLIGITEPLPVIGDSSLKLSTVGELRALLLRQQSMDQDEDDGNEGFRF